MYSLNIEKKAVLPPEPSEIRLQAAILSSLAAVAVSFLARFAFGAPLVPEVLADFVFALLPISLVEFGVGLLGPFAKQLGFIGCVVAYFIALAAAAELSLRIPKRHRRLAIVLLGAAAWAVTMFAVFPAIGAGIAGKSTRQGAQ
ncbi:MAG: hypothetical protein ACREDR_34830 [Blastocatellia bacterium]